MSQKIIPIYRLPSVRNDLVLFFVTVNPPREEDGAIEFWRLKDYLRIEFENSRYWSDDKWKRKDVKRRRQARKDFNIVPTPSRQEILYLRALQGQPGRNLIDPTLQDNVLIPNNFHRVHLSHRMCDQFTLHHRIQDWQREDKIWAGKDRRYSLQSVDPMDKEHKNPEKILTWPSTASCTVPADSVEETSKHGVYWVDLQLAQRKGLKFYQTRSNAIIFSRHTSSLLYPEGYHDGIWRSHIREGICVSSTSSEDFL